MRIRCWKGQLPIQCNPGLLVFGSANCQVRFNGIYPIDLRFSPEQLNTPRLQVMLARETRLAICTHEKPCFDSLVGAL